MGWKGQKNGECYRAASTTHFNMHALSQHGDGFYMTGSLLRFGPFGQLVCGCLLLTLLGCRGGNRQADIDDTESLRAASPERSQPHSLPWPGLLGPFGNASTSSNGLHLDFGSSGPPVMWRTAIGNGYSAPVVSDGLVVVSHRLGNHEHVDAFELSGGARVWRYSYATQFKCPFEYSSGPYSTPVIADGSVYAWSAEGDLRCLELATGELLWERRLSTEYQVPQPDFPVAASPLVHDGRVVLNVGGTVGQSGVVALDCRNGQTLWASTEELAAYTTPVVCEIDGRQVVFVLGYDHLLALDLTSGAELWRRTFHARNRSLGKLNAASPLVIGGHVYVTAHSKGILCMAVSLGGGADVWEHSARRLSNQMSPLVRGKMGLLGFTTRNRTFRCLDIENGEILWEWQSTIGREPQYLLAGEHVVMLGETGQLALFDASQVPLKLVCQMDEPLLAGPCFTTPVIGYGKLVVRNDQELVCCSLDSKSQAAPFQGRQPESSGR